MDGSRPALFFSEIFMFVWLLWEPILSASKLSERHIKFVVYCEDFKNGFSSIFIY